MWYNSSVYDAVSSRITDDSRLSFDEGVGFLRAKMLEESKALEGYSLAKKYSLNLLDANQDELEHFLSGAKCTFSKLFADYALPYLKNILSIKTDLQGRIPVQIALTYGTLRDKPVLVRKCFITKAENDYEMQLDKQMVVYKPIAEKFDVADNHRYVKVRGKFNFEKAIADLNAQNLDTHSRIHTTAIISLFYDYDASTFGFLTKLLEENPQLAAHSNMLQALSSDTSSVYSRRSIKMYNNNSYDALFREYKYLEVPDLAPDEEFGVGDLDLQERLLIRAYAEEKSMNVLSPANMRNANLIAAMIAQGASQGERVLYIPADKTAVESVKERLRDLDLQSLLLDLTLRKKCDEQIRKSIQTAAKSAALTIGVYSPELSEQLKEVSEELQAQSQTLTTLFQPWNISIEQLVESIIAAGDLPEFTTRLSRDTCLNSLGKQDALAGEIGNLLELDYALNARSSSIFQSDIVINYWTEVKIHKLDDTYEIIEKLERLLDVLLPSLALYIDEITSAAKLKKPGSVAQWNELSALLAGVRHTLDVFTNDIFERDISEYVDVTAPRDDDEKSDYSFFERNHLLKEANALLRPGQTVEDLHQSLKEAARLKQTWLDLSTASPSASDLLSNASLIHLPNQVGKAISVSRSLNIDLKAIDKIFEESTHFDTLFELDFESLKSLLSNLVANKGLLQQVFERTYMVDELHSLGVGYLALELSKGKVACEDVEPALQKVLSLSILEYILESNPDIEVDSTALDILIAKFQKLDAKHIENLSVPVKYFAGQKQLSALDNAFGNTGAKAVGKGNSADGVLEDENAFMHDYFVAFAASKNALGLVSRSIGSFDTVILERFEIADLPYVYAALLCSKRVVLFGDAIAKTPQLSDIFKEVMPTFEFNQVFSSRDVRLSKIIADNGFEGLEILPQNTYAQPSVTYTSARSGVVEVLKQLIRDQSTSASKAQSKIAIFCAPNDLSAVKHSLLQAIQDDKSFRAAAASFERRKGCSISILEFGKVHSGYTEAILFASQSLKDVPDLEIVYALLGVQGKLHVVADAKIKDDQVTQLLKVLENAASHTLSPLEAHDFLQVEEAPVTFTLEGAPAQASAKQIATALSQSLARRGGYETIQNFNLSRNPHSAIPLCVFAQGHQKGVAVLIDQFLHKQSLRYALRLREQDLRALGWEVVHISSLLYYQNPALAVSRITDALLDDGIREASKQRAGSSTQTDQRAHDILHEKPPHHIA